MTKSWACKLVSAALRPADSGTGIAFAVQIKASKGTIRRMLLRWPKGGRGCRKSSKGQSNGLFVFFIVIFVKVVPIVRLLVLFFLVIIFRDDVHFDGVDLNHFHFC